MNINVSIIGATGYAGAELLRLLLSHQNVTVAAVSSVSFTGQEISEVYPSFQSIFHMKCCAQSEAVDKGDVVFACLPHGLSEDLALECADRGKIFIDLGADFRLEAEEDYTEWYKGGFKHPKLHKQAVYGLPELFREKIKGKKIIANPGCYTTGVPLALAPAIASGLIDPSTIIADCKSGVTGAGRQPTNTTHFPELNEGFMPYKVASHRHTPEMEQTLRSLAGKDVKITFVPHLLPINRGIVSTCYASLDRDISLEALHRIYSEFYKDEFFIRVLNLGKTANLKYVKYTNYCDISVHTDIRTNRLIAVSAIDNMVKGAAGQAIQNMNIVCGLPEQTGLTLVPPSF